MSRTAMEGTCLAKLVRMAIPLYQKAERTFIRCGPGAPPTYAHWQIATLILIAIMARRKSKSAQYRYLYERRDSLMKWLNMQSFPARSSYFDRYRKAYGLFRVAILLQAKRAYDEGLVDPTVVAVDKSLMASHGPVWHQRQRRKGKCPRGVDVDAHWGYCTHHGWVYGYSFEVVVSATKGSVVFPLDVSIGPGNTSESKSFSSKIKHLPEQTRYVDADAAYDTNDHSDAIEYDTQDRPTGRRLVCPLMPRAGKSRVGQYVRRGRRERLRLRRGKHLAFFNSRKGQRIYQQRHKTVEPFNEWFKTKFDLHERVWHRGLANNATQIAAAIFAYQLLLRYHRKNGGNNGAVQWILDSI